MILFDHSLEVEKPCGGGVTGKALSRIPLFRDLKLPFNDVRTMRMLRIHDKPAEVSLRSALQIFSRRDLDSYIRRSAVAAGTRLIPERAVKLSRQNGGWQIRTPGSELEVDYLIGADGARSKVRAATSGSFRSTDLSLAIGYCIPGKFHPEKILVEFLEQGFEGYIWSFPRVDHLSTGILRWLPAAHSEDMRTRLLQFVETQYRGMPSERSLYAACIPCLNSHTLLQQKTAGLDWALLGDAAGFADAITAEGIHYALRSAELLAQSLVPGAQTSYESLWKKDFLSDLHRAALWRDRFFGGTFLMEAFTGRALQSLRHSSTMRNLTTDLISGNSSYERLRRQIIIRSPQILLEACASLLKRKVSAPPSSPPGPDAGLNP